MLNIAHVYSYYEAYHDLEAAMSDNIEFLESINGETVLDLLLKPTIPNYTIVNKAVEYVLRKIENNSNQRLLMCDYYNAR